MIEIVEADLSLPAHAEAMVQLMDEYALDPMGGGKGLSDYVKTNLRAELAKRKAAHVILAFVDAEPAGLVVCLEGFSTFACKPLLNIHDVFVALPYRRRGLSQLLLQKAEEIAFDLGCCKLTLEVLEGNHVAQLAYKACGFSGYELNPQMGKALFWEKKLAQVTDEEKNL
ncbi:GNAT family N-acetyltransferase [Anabaena sp. CA = ATCC 33047]|uniref:GNAT family N-acetyltransferase n=1 Tax=Anabaena sp. (strain CA / ATCC 33047) TaxID=52271 RepID=UPI00082D246D|nr:GNAT family N-acetyltransferase [Anabaena sp. CA = ATCC 33047]